MKIIVKAFSDFKKYLPLDAPQSGWEVEVNGGATIENLLEQQDIPLNISKIFTVNDSNRKSDFILNDGDVLKIFPMPMGG